MAYGDVKRQVESIVFTNPTGLTTQQIYERAGARTAGEQSLVRTVLRKFANGRNPTLLRVAAKSRPSGRGARTFLYFHPNSGRQQYEQFRDAPAQYRPGGIQQVRSRATTNGSGGHTANMAAMFMSRAATTRDQVMGVISQHPNGIDSTSIAKTLGIANDQARSALSGLVAKKAILRTRTGNDARKVGPGGAPFRYFPKNETGRAAMRQFIEDGGFTYTKKKRSFAVTKQPTTAAPAPIFPTQTAANVQVRITLTDGATFDIQMSRARELRDALNEAFA